MWQCASNFDRQANWIDGFLTKEKAKRQEYKVSLRHLIDKHRWKMPAGNSLRGDVLELIHHVFELCSLSELSNLPVEVKRITQHAHKCEKTVKYQIASHPSHSYPRTKLCSLGVLELNQKTQTPPQAPQKV